MRQGLLLASVVGLTATAAVAEVVPSRDAKPDVLAALERMDDTLVSAFVWDVDMDSDGRPERLVQAGFTPGGNGWYTRFFVFPTGAVDAPLEINAGAAVFFDEVRTTPKGPVAVTRSYGDGDGRCCPSVVGQMSLQLEDLDRF